MLHRPRSSVTTCREFAISRLSKRPLKESTVREYLATLRVLGLEDLPHHEATVMLINSRLQTVLNASTRRKHAINLRATLGVEIPCPRPSQKLYALPPMTALRDAVEDSPYAMWGLVMLYAGL